METFRMLAPCLFGLESVLAHEVRAIGAHEVTVQDGRVLFSGEEAVLARANLFLRCAERVCIVLGSYEAKTFTQLFDGAMELPFERFIGKNDAFPVKGWSLKSALHSIPDCQSILKKAAVRRLQDAYALSWFEETGPARQVRFTIHRDVATIMLDTSGTGLHKRGYRPISAEAPIKETLAAGIADLARTRKDDRVIDPMCGSGTLVIESALRAYGIAPGLRRRFAAEGWNTLDAGIWKAEREKAMAGIDKSAGFVGIARDIDPAAATLTRENAIKAGVGRKIEAAQGDIRDFSCGKGDIVLCNPPYGERLLEIKEAEELYRLMGEAYARSPGSKWYVISPHESFEKLFKKRADKRRKLYNGMIRCQLFMYYS